MVRSNTGLRTSRLMIYIVAIRKLAERKSIRKPVSKQIIAITAKPPISTRIDTPSPQPVPTGIQHVHPRPKSVFVLLTNDKRFLH